MALVRRTLEQIKASSPKSDWKKVRATTEADIRRHIVEDGGDPEHLPALDEVFTPQVIRKRLGMTQEQFARALHVPVATLRNWEQGRNAIDPAARSLLTIVARNPRLVLQTLKSAAE